MRLTSALLTSILLACSSSNIAPNVLPEAGAPDATASDAASPPSTPDASSPSRLPDAAAPDAGAPGTPDGCGLAASAGPRAPGGTGSVTFAITKLYFGETNPDDTLDFRDGWKQYGFDLDNRASTARSTDLCKGTGAPSAYADGHCGIDNSYGKNILPITLAHAPDANLQLNELIAQGGPTVLISIDALGGGDAYDPIAGKIHQTQPLGTVPRYDGTDRFPVSPGHVSFANAYVVANTLIVRVTGSLTIPFASGATSLPLSIINPVISMPLSADHTRVQGGKIGGVIVTEELITQLRRSASEIDPSYCDENNVAFQAIADQYRRASDSLTSGGQDPNLPCNAISIGLGFDAKLVQVGAVTSPPRTKVPCTTAEPPPVPPPPSAPPPTSCFALIDCYAKCAYADAECINACTAAASPNARGLYDRAVSCGQTTCETPSSVGATPRCAGLDDYTDTCNACWHNAFASDTDSCLALPTPPEDASCQACTTMLNACLDDK